MHWKERNTATFLGKTVTVQVDRPIGFVHKGMEYPVNYGFLPGVPGGDGEDLDAYILCVDSPVNSYTGRVIGVVQRHNDCEDKLVVAPEGILLHQAQIMEAVQFQEQFFETSIVCLLRKSCGVIPLRKTPQGLQILLVYEQFSQCWSLPKGHMEPFETEVQTALRELREETGLTAHLLENHKTVIAYPINPISYKQMVLFLGYAQGQPTGRPGEIERCRWVNQRELADYLFADTAAAVQALLEKACLDETAPEQE